MPQGEGGKAPAVFPLFFCLPSGWSGMRAEAEEGGARRIRRGGRGAVVAEEPAGQARRRKGGGRRKGRGSTRRGWICGRRVCAVAEERPAAGRPKKPRAGRPKDRQAFRMRGMRVIFLQRCRNIRHSHRMTGCRNICHSLSTTGRRNDRVGVSGRASAERMPDAR